MRHPDFADTIPSEPTTDSLEEVLGPVHGFFLACYSVATTDGYFAYAKVCPRRPVSIWQADAVKKVVAGPFSTPEVALDAVIRLASDRLARRAARKAALPSAA